MRIQTQAAHPVPLSATPYWTHSSGCAVAWSAILGARIGTKFIAPSITLDHGMLHVKFPSSTIFMENIAICRRLRIQYTCISQLDAPVIYAPRYINTFTRETRYVAIKIGECKRPNPRYLA